MKRQRFINLVGTEFMGKVGWSSHQADITTTHRKLKEALGKYRRGNDKTSVEYFIMLDDGTVFSVYDYKYYGKDSAYRNPDKEIEFSIGAQNKVEGAKAFVFLNQILKESEESELK
jgi:hypothetical protein